MLPSQHHGQDQQATTADRPGRPLTAPSNPQTPLGTAVSHHLLELARSGLSGLALVRARDQAEFPTGLSGTLDCPRGLVCVLPELGCLTTLLLAQAVIPKGTTAPNGTGRNGMPSQPELPRPYWGGLSGRWAVIS